MANTIRVRYAQNAQASTDNNAVNNVSSSSVLRRPLHHHQESSTTSSYPVNNRDTTPVLLLTENDGGSKAEDDKLKSRQIQKSRLKALVGSLLILSIFLGSSKVFIMKGDGLRYTLTGFLNWVTKNPFLGVFAYIGVYSMTVALMIPCTPLMLGGGFVFSQVLGFSAGIIVATLAVLIGATIGAVTAFCLGKYLLRDYVKTWFKKYPIFEAIDAAVADSGFRLMCLLHLTPIVPFGPISYMIGTTSISIFSFAASNIACIPFILLYVVIGATTGSLITGVDGLSFSKIVFGIVLSALSLLFISRQVRHELTKVLERQGVQKRSRENNCEEDSNQSGCVHLNTLNETDTLSVV